MELNVLQRYFFLPKNFLKMPPGELVLDEEAEESSR
jgi:hypothetical protein